MKIKLLLLFVFSISHNAFAQWDNLNTGISDNLNGVVFFQQNGLVSGENGLYYTINGGSGSASWTELHIPGNPSTAIFEETRFSHCYALKTNASAAGEIYACGQTNSDNKAVLFKIDLPSLNCTLLYQGAANTKLNKIDCQDGTTNIIAVGNNGKVIRFSGAILTEMTPITTENLLSVSYSGSFDVVFGSSDKIWKARTSGNTFTTITTVGNSAVNCEDIFVFGSSIYLAGGNKAGVMVFTNTAPTYYSNYFAPLDMNCIGYKGGIFVGTNQGIYKYGGSSLSIANSYIEWQPSSSTNKYNAFWTPGVGTYAYAVGDNGVLVRSSNQGGATKPYVRLDLPDFCLNTARTISAYTGSGNAAAWYINGQLTSSSLSGFSHTFTALGQNLISVTVTNSFGETTTVSQTINVVPMPTIDKPVVLSDVLLCKEESIQIQIQNSEPNVRYYLRKVGESNSNYGMSDDGNGETIAFTTGLITLTGSYYIEAINTSGNCARRFTADIAIVVEETKADFHFNVINAIVGEPVNYYNQSVDAQHYLWQFTGAGNQSSNIEGPQFSYASAGQVSVNLDAWSNNNCHDIITKNGPNVIEAITSPPDCMQLVNYGEDLPWPGYYREDISDSSKTTDGFVTCGSYNNVIFDSAYGVKLSLLGKRGGYLTKYDKNGVLKWAVYTVNQNTTSSENSNFFKACAVDGQGNIYISGTSTGKFYDNGGHIINLAEMTPSFATPSRFLIKLNSKGEFIWRMQNQFLDFNNMLTDSNNNVIVQTGNGFVSNTTNIQLYFNGVASQIVGNSVPVTDAYMGLMKINPLGSVLWDTKIKDIFGGAMTIENIGLDNTDNLYIAYSNMYGLIFHSANNANPKSLLVGGFGIAKYNSAGICSWATKSQTTGLLGSNPSSTYASTMVVDGAGNLYLSGRNECTPSPSGDQHHVFYNTNNTTTETLSGTYYVAKINTDGICQWVNTTSEKVFGSSVTSVVDGNRWYVLGSISSGNSNIMATANFESSNNANYQLTMNRNNNFLAVYDLDGNLDQMYLSSEANNSFVAKYYRGFLKDNENFYLVRDFDGGTGYQDFGNVFPAITDYEGTVMKFKASCGTLKYDRLLETTKADKTFSAMVVYPNPTSGQFIIDLLDYYCEIEMEVYDLFGKCINKQRYSNVYEINAKIEVSAGIYFIKIKGHEKEQWLKLIKN